MNLLRFSRSLLKGNTRYYQPLYNIYNNNNIFNNFSSSTKKNTKSNKLNKRSVLDLISDLNTPLDDKPVLLRADLNVPLSKNETTGEMFITDDTRIRSTLPTIRCLLGQGVKLIICSHLGRPKGKVVNDLKMDPVAKRLSELLDQPVKKLDDCIGDNILNEVNAMMGGDVILLENLRFHKEETENEPKFSKELAKVADIFVNDAFGTAHRAHSSTYGVAEYMRTKVAGFLVEKEIKFLSGALEDDPDNKKWIKRPLVAIIGGAKVSSKLSLIDSMINKCDAVLIGGAMAFTFLKAKGFNVGKSLVEDDFLSLAKDIIDKTDPIINRDSNIGRIVLPVDVVISKDGKGDHGRNEVLMDEIPDDMMGVDIGSASLSLFNSELQSAKTIVWNGPMGLFESPPYDYATSELARIISERTWQGAISIVGGGDSVAAINQLGFQDSITHISTGGGACLELLEGKTLPGIDILDDIEN